jgi:hypothetical protein
MTTGSCRNELSRRWVAPETLDIMIKSLSEDMALSGSYEVRGRDSSIDAGSSTQPNLTSKLLGRSLVNALSRQPSLVKILI